MLQAYGRVTPTVLGASAPVSRPRLTPPCATPNPGDGFERSPLQQAIKDADDAVDDMRKSAGSALNDAFTPIGKALGMGTRSSEGAEGEQADKVLKGWEAAQATLVKEGLKSVPVEGVAALMADGYVLIDCRPSSDYESQHAAGSVSAPLVRDIEGFNLRKALFMAQAVRAIEDNPDWSVQVSDAAKGAKGVIFACGSGGTIRPTVNFPSGQSSRSLLAAHGAITQGLVEGEVLHLQGGLTAWIKAGLPSEGTGEWEDMAGKTPYVPGWTIDQDAEELM